MVKFIADVGSNHNRDLDRVYCLIKTAKEVGCWAVKFQLFRPDDLYRELTAERRAELELASLPWEFIPQIAKWCKEFDLVFGCTPFSIEAVDYLAPYVDYFKISSYEILRLNLIRWCAKRNKPIHISTGMADLSEINAARRAAFPRNPIIYSCRADYPARPEDCMFDSYFFMNWSDHTVEPGVIYSAVGRCAEYIEFHLDIEDMAGNESKHGHVWNPSKIRDVIRTVRVMENSWWSSDHRDYDYNDTNKRADPIDGKRPRILS